MRSSREVDSRVWRVVGDPLIAAASHGPLDGATVAVKDVFAVAGYATGGGVPAYEQSVDVAADHATAVARLIHAGARVRGIARTDQFAYSMAGDNPHYGTPPNAAVPEPCPADRRAVRRVRSHTATPIWGWRPTPPDQSGYRLRIRGCGA